MRLGALLAAGTLVVAACGPSPLSGLDTTPLDPIVTVNGVPFGKLGPAGLELDRSLPPLPWVVAATTPTGRVLVTLEIPGEDHEGTYARADLSCGTVMLWFGNEPIYGPAPPPPGAAGVQGDCDP